ncbi:MAG TPA: hypothetical protein VM734_22510 [Kofleriaceae bacterium]|nr:hypothetical protein [Kofleriaceae bacterium]
MIPLQLSALAVLTHPGHGATASPGWAHYLTEPVHVVVLVAVGCVAVAGAVQALRALRAARAARPRWGQDPGS